MMYNSNKKVVNKYAIVFVSFLIFLCSMLSINPSWLNKFYGETLCASSTAPTLDSTYFNYKDSSFASKFDYAFNNLESFSTSSSSCYLDFSVVPLGNYDFSYFTASMLSATSRNIVYYGPANLDLTNSYGSFSSYNYYSLSTYQLKSIRFTYRSSYSTYNILLDLSNTGLMSWISNLDFVVSYSYNNIYYTVCSMSLYNKYLAYQDGLADADTDTAYQNGYTAGQSDGYNSGYTAGNSAGVTTGQNNVLNNPNDYNLYTQSQYDSNYTNGYNAGVIQGQNNVINNPHNYGLFTQADLDSEYQRGYRIGQEDIEVDPNNYGYYTESQYQNNYDNGFRDGQESSTNYQDGIIQGQNNVINNPHNYGLFTQADLDSEYQRGYNDGVNYTTNLYDGYGNFLYSKFYWTSFADKYTPLVYNGSNSSNYVLSGVFGDYLNYFDRFVGGFTLNSSYVSMIQDLDGRFIDGDGLSLDRTILWFEFDNFVAISQFPNIVTPNAIRLGSIYYVELSDGTILEYNGADTVFDGISLSNYDNLYIVRIGMGFTNVQDYMSSSNGMAFNTRDSLEYQLGYNDGNKYGFDKGKKDGYNVGYAEGRSDGINSADGNTFTSLIMAVVDAPINMFKSLFNFDILGFNLLGFATGVFTLCVFIFIIKKFIGK